MIEGTLAGVRIRISPLFTALLLVLLSFDDSRLPLWCFLATLLHEGGHLLLLCLWRRPPAAITVNPFGLHMQQCAGVGLSYGQSAAVSLAGPLVNFLCFGILTVTGHGGAPAGVHAVMGLLHLLPIGTLDGAQALYSLLCLAFGEPAARRVSFWLSILLLIPLSAAGFYLLLCTGYNATLLALCGYLAAEIFFLQNR